jgi:hypothetical protein
MDANERDIIYIYWFILMKRIHIHFFRVYQVTGQRDIRICIEKTSAQIFCNTHQLYPITIH